MLRRQVEALSVADLQQLMQTYGRIAITGAPHTGKTTLAHAVQDGRPLVHGDAFQALGWSEASQALMEAVNAVEGPVLVEGTAVPRALRKGMRVDLVIALAQPHTPLTPGQRTMAKGVLTVLWEWHARHPETLVVVVQKTAALAPERLLTEEPLTP